MPIYSGTQPATDSVDKTESSDSYKKRSEERLVSNTEIRDKNDASGNFLVNAGNAIHDFNNWIGTGIDNGFDNFVLNHFKDKDKAQRWADRYSGEDLALIPDILEDIGILAATTAAAQPHLGIGLLMAKGGLQNAENFHEAITGKDIETGDELTGKQRAAKGAGAAINTLIYGLPMPAGKIASKIGGKAVTSEAGKAIEKSIAQEATAAEQLYNAFALNRLFQKQGIRDIGDIDNYMSLLAKGGKLNTKPQIVDWINPNAPETGGFEKFVKHLTPEEQDLVMQDFMSRNVGASTILRDAEQDYQKAYLNNFRTNPRQAVISSAKDEEGKALYGTMKQRMKDRKGFKEAIEKQKKDLQDRMNEAGIKKSDLRKNSVTNGIIRTAAWGSIPTLAYGSGFLNAYGENGDNMIPVLHGVDRNGNSGFRGTAGAALALMLLGPRAAKYISRSASASHSGMYRAIQNITQNPEFNFKNATRNKAIAQAGGWRTSDILPASFIAATGNNNSDTRYLTEQELKRLVPDSKE